MIDPRAENCRAMRWDNGKVRGVELSYTQNLSTRYQLTSVRLRDEDEAQGQTVARVTVLDKDGNNNYNTGVYLFWPYPSVDNSAVANNSNYPYEHLVVNAYSPPGLGFLGIYVGLGEIDSDLIGGLGLPNGHHVSFDMTFQERGGDPVDPPIDPPIDPDDGDILERLQRIEAKLDKLSYHVGVR